MSAYFLDSSATVKRFSAESGTNFVINIFKPSNCHIVYVSEIQLAEVVSALSRQTRGGFLSSVQSERAIRRFCRIFQKQCRKLSATIFLIE